jgi:hypothetical protein
MFIKKSIALILYAIAILALNISYTQEFEEQAKDKVKYKAIIEQNSCEAYIILNIDIIENWHINAANLPIESYSFATQINLDSSINYYFDNVINEPSCERTYDSIAKEYLYLHDGSIYMKKRIYILSEKNFILNGEFVFQTCDDKHCLPIHTEKFNIKVNGCVEEQKNQVSVEDEPLPISLLYIFGCFIIIIIVVIYIKKK